MAFIGVITVLIVFLRQVARGLSSRINLILLSALLFSPVLLICLNLWWGKDTSRQRVDVQFVGYSIPWSTLRPCSAPPNPNAPGGIWLGGGSRWERDVYPDVFVIPGYRSHLIEVCSDSKSGSGGIQVRLVRPGFKFASKILITPSEAELPTQRVALDSSSDESALYWKSDECLVGRGTNLSLSRMESFISSVWRQDRSLNENRATWRSRIKSYFNSLPQPGPQVYCIDLSGQPKRCASSSNPQNTAFVWRAKQEGQLISSSRWAVVPPVGMKLNSCRRDVGKTSPEMVKIRPTLLKEGDSVIDTAKDALPWFSLRMITRRTVGGVADENVPVYAGSVIPAAFRLGPSHRVSLARKQDALLLLVEEPSVQIRADDLFSEGSSSVPKGTFYLTFGQSEKQGILVVDLANVSDELSTKPVMQALGGRVRIPEWDSSSFTVDLGGAYPESHSFGEAFQIADYFNKEKVNPLILIKKIDVPRAVWVVPMAACLLAFFGLLAGFTHQMDLDFRWDIVGMLIILLDFRFLLSTRALMVSPSSRGYIEDWLVCGCLPLLAPPALFMASRVTEKAFAKLQKLVHLRSYTHPNNSPVLRDGSWQVIQQWFGLSSLFTMIWLLGGGVGSTWHWRYSLAFVVGKSFFSQALTIATSVFLTVSLWLLLLGRRSGLVDPLMSFNPSFGRKQLRALLLRVIIFSGGAFLLRLALFAFGLQESGLGGVKLDVFYLPLVAAAFAVLSEFRLPSNKETWRLVSFAILGGVSFLVTGLLVSDLGLLWVGGFGIVLALPFVAENLGPVKSALASSLVFLVLFISPKFSPDLFLLLLRQMGETTVLTTKHGEISFDDVLLVSRERDHYRMMDAVRPQSVEEIPSQLAREVVAERERVRYQALKGAWRAGIQDSGSAESVWLGAGLLQARPIVGEKTFRDAARSDYVYPLYVRSEYGSWGILSLFMIYLSMFLVVACTGESSPLALWAMAIAVGTSLFMLGGTNGIFPFSGKWPLFMALGSRSDVCLGIVLLTLVFTRRSEIDG